MLKKLNARPLFERAIRKGFATLVDTLTTPSTILRRKDIVLAGELPVELLRRATDEQR